MKAEFEIGDKVWYDLSEPQDGIIIDIEYSFAYEVFWYIVSFGAGVVVECRDYELVRDKPVI